jgi:DNA-3-methyladenine glycosylase II
MAVTSMAVTPPPYTRAALAHLRRTDPVMARLIEHVGPYRPPKRPDRFQALVRAIVFQQLAGRAAQAIYDRFVAIFEGPRFPTPAQVLGAPIPKMRKAGLSRAKTLYIRDLAAHVAKDSINFRRFRWMNDEEIIEHLTMVKGIGRWTAEMFLMFNLWRPDVLPVGDLGVRNAAMKAYAMRTHPTAKQLRALGERWRPYRSVATWYLWRSTAIVLPADSSKPARPKR